LNYETDKWLVSHEKNHVYEIENNKEDHLKDWYAL